MGLTFTIMKADKKSFLIPNIKGTQGVVMAGKAVYRKMASKIGGLQAAKRLYGENAAMNKPIFKKHLNKLGEMSTLPSTLSSDELKTIYNNQQSFLLRVPKEKIVNKFGARPFTTAQYYRYFGFN